jgi:hypothetical protein
VKTFVSHINQLSNQAARLQSAAKACAPFAVTDEAGAIYDSMDSGEPAEDCADCTGACFCNCHSGLVTGPAMDVAPAIPQALLAEPATSWSSRASPPFLPPPIAT